MCWLCLDRITMDAWLYWRKYHKKLPQIKWATKTIPARWDRISVRISHCLLSDKHPHHGSISLDSRLNLSFAKSPMPTAHIRVQCTLTIQRLVLNWRKLMTSSITLLSTYRVWRYEIPMRPWLTQMPVSLSQISYNDRPLRPIPYFSSLLQQFFSVCDFVLSLNMRDA